MNSREGITLQTIKLLENQSLIMNEVLDIDPIDQDGFYEMLNAVDDPTAEQIELYEGNIEYTPDINKMLGMLSAKDKETRNLAKQLLLNEYYRK